MLRNVLITLAGGILPFWALAQNYIRVDTVQPDTVIKAVDYYFDVPFGQTFISSSHCRGYSVLKSRTFDPMLRRSLDVRPLGTTLSAHITWGAPQGSNTEGTLVESNQGRTLRNSISNLDYSNEGIQNNILDLKVDAELPVNLVMNLGLGQARLDLSNVHLHSADISTAETNLVISFSRVNDCKVTHFRIKAGTSELLLRNPENAHAERIVIENGMGNTTIALGNEIPFPAQIYVEVGAGTCTVTIEENTPLKVIFNDGGVSSAEMPAEFVSKGSNVYVNSHWQNNPSKAVTITLDLGMGTFKIIPYHQ